MAHQRVVSGCRDLLEQCVLSSNATVFAAGVKTVNIAYYATVEQLARIADTACGVRATPHSLGAECFRAFINLPEQRQRLVDLS